MSSSNNTTCYYKITGKKGVDNILVAAGVAVVVGAVFLLSLFSVLIFLRRKAFNNPAKRFGLSLIVAIWVLCVGTAVFLFYPASSLPQWLCVVTMVFFCVGSTADFYLVALPAALLLQVSAPLMPETFCHKITPVVPLIEVILQIVILISSLLINGLQLLDQRNSTAFCKKCVTLYNYDIYTLALSVLVLFVTLLILAVVYCKFRSAIVLTKKTRLVILKVLFLFLIANAAFIGHSIISASNDNDVDIALSISITLLNILVLPALIVLMYSPNTSCNKSWCYCQQREPLLPKQSEEAPTNPESVWDHVNVPSYTTYHPLEMSDCQ